MISLKVNSFSNKFSFFAMLRGIKIKEYKFEIINNVSYIKRTLLLGEKEIYILFLLILLLSSSDSEESLSFFFFTVKVLILSFILFLILFL